MLQDFLIFKNAEPLWQNDLPKVSSAALVEKTARNIAAGARLVQWFGQLLASTGTVRLYSILADDTGHRLGILTADLTEGSSYPSLTSMVPAADRAEREVFEQFGIRPDGHPWLKPLRHPVKKAELKTGRTLGLVPENNIGRHYPFWKLAGDAVHEVGVGPVHAGIIGDRKSVV